MEIKKQEICVYKDAHPKATCSDIAAHFAKEWVAQQWAIFYAAKKSECLMSALVEQQNMASLEKHLCCGLMNNIRLYPLLTFSP